jgi:hypothetical protein
MASQKRRTEKTSKRSGARSAADIKDLGETLPDFTPEELRAIPVAPNGAPLKEGGVYLDLRNRAFGPFIAAPGSTAEEHHLYVAKAEVTADYWNRLMPKRDETRDEKQVSSNKGTPAESMIDKTLADSFPTSDPPPWTTGRDKE